MKQAETGPKSADKEKNIMIMLNEVQTKPF
jgi:hypothetical protein